MSGCWLWPASTTPNGYGQFGPIGSHRLAHRFSWEIYKGKIPDGMCVCHHCDVTSCVNPDHLFLGTYSDNMRDMVKKKRGPQAKKTHCPQGHPYSGSNLVPAKSAFGREGRRCRTCSNEWRKNRRRVRSKDPAYREMTNLKRRIWYRERKPKSKR